MPIKLPSFRPRRDVYPPDLWTKCPSCGEMLFNKQLEKNDRICPTCEHHFRISAMARLEMLLDPGTFQERDAGLQSLDPLGFVDQKAYPDRIATAQSQTGLRDAAVRGIGAIEGMAVSICVMDFGFMGGSMGAVVGEKVTRAAEDALAERLPLIIVSASGGARMQEGTLALMQLAKTCAILERVRASRVPYVSVMSDPTTGGVFASYAVLGDVNLAEPNALIGFAGARVSAGTIAQELPAGFQRSEFLFEHGFIDRVITRRALRGEIASLLRFMRVPELATVDSRSGFSPVGAFVSSMVGVASGVAGVATGVATGVASAVTGSGSTPTNGSAGANGNGTAVAAPDAEGARDG
ncbi:MAG TPA: acetyl-CoA carboxylase, carboxyltransferase subunit beta [Candidatus Limnocylindrales bacterium]|jgi:acetyl-CoA carboxylase carboxyl transferase subunit beta